MNTSRVANATFSSLLLAEARAEAKRQGIILPFGIVALKVGRSQWAVQADHPHNFDHYVSASCAAEAKAKWIGQLIDAHEFKCQGCGREESVCSADPCPGVIADREAVD
jgi:hypothetical protein